ncbi:pentapeptide repeat-containing protein [Mycobacterium sp. M26]|uniref:pentapeptide repeat-containing protein n=1 Tax=Mycobacterium sp. M26 TaxID=1762962 RepID=UPI00073E4E8A|nr:pentapeptide repeat-containing protein [Mycobacterium sp. M26]
MSEGRRPARKVISEVLSDPNWWFKEVVIALIIGGLLAAASIVGQKMVDDARSEREVNAALAANRHDLQLENLRFVRDRSWDTPDDARRFAEFDLAGQNLVELRLAGSDFARADLTEANLSGSDLSKANLARATLQGTNLTRADLREAYLGPERIPDAPDQLGADLTGADLRYADLSGADLGRANLTGAMLDHAILTNVFYDQQTIWPQGFTPPPSRPTR